MRAFVHDVLPWIMSAVTLYMTVLQGRKTWKAWAVGLGNQLLWLIFILSTETWGLLPLNIGLWLLYIRNLLLWYAEEHDRNWAHNKQWEERWLKCSCWTLQGCDKCGYYKATGE